jgi:nitric oxide reductase activation protein
MKRAIAKLGARAIPGNTKLGYALRAWRKELIADLGGEDNVSVQQRTIVELASTTKLMISSVDAWIMSQPSLLTRERTLIPVIMQRQQLANSLTSMMAQLGLQRRHKVKSLHEILSNDNDTPADTNGNGAADGGQ